MAELILGPMLRHVSETSATIWVETDERCTVEHTRPFERRPSASRAITMPWSFSKVSSRHRRSNTR